MITCGLRELRGYDRDERKQAYKSPWICYSFRKNHASIKEVATHPQLWVGDLFTRLLVANHANFKVKLEMLEMLERLKERIKRGIGDPTPGVVHRQAQPDIQVHLNRAYVKSHISFVSGQ